MPRDVLLAEQLRAVALAAVELLREARPRRRVLGLALVGLGAAAWSAPRSRPRASFISAFFSGFAIGVIWSSLRLPSRNMKSGIAG